MIIKKKLPREKGVHSQTAVYLRLQYPDVIFRTDYAAGMKLTAGQAAVHKSLQSDRSYPDLYVAEARHGYHGLYIELKRDRSEIMNKNGLYKKKIVQVYKKIGGKKVRVSSYDHIDEQRKMLDRLNKKGYKAVFGCGFFEIKNIIDEYLKT